jgi:hypothetical protein
MRLYILFMETVEETYLSYSARRGSYKSTKIDS